MPDPDSRRAAVGPTGEQVVKNVEELREERGLSLRGLRDRLAGGGRPIAASQLHALSKGERRVDADDLVGLALALGVNPNALLFDRHAARDDILDVTPELRQRAWLVWAWADGKGPLPGSLVPEDAVVTRSMSDVVDFDAHARPDLSRPWRHPAVHAAEQLVTEMLAVIGGKDVIGGMLADIGHQGDAGSQGERVRRALQRLQIEVDELLDKGR